MNTKSTITLILFSALVTPLLGQCPKRAQKLIDKAVEQQITSLNEAIESLNKAISICPQSEEALFLVADLYREQKNHTEVKRVLDQYLKIQTAPDPRAYYFLAESERKLFLFDEAAMHYQKFLDSESTSRRLNYRAGEYLEDVKFAKMSYAEAPDVLFEPMPGEINTNYSEYLAIMTADERKMVFTRREEVSEEAYYTELIDDSTWSDSKTLHYLPENLRKAAVSISVDGNMLVFAMADHIQGHGNFDLYYVEKSQDGWSTPKNFGKNVNTPGWESQPCVSADGRTVYFSSNRKGGEGGNDIWKTKRDVNGLWSIPTNLGVEVNSAGNEESPFIHRDQRTLYFRSDGHPGLGEFDIFMSRHIRFQKWTEPINLGYPVNTIGNDGSLFVSLDGTIAYIASDVDHTQLDDYRNQTLNDNTDIYRFELHEQYRPIPTTYIRLHFVDAENLQRLQPNVELIDFVSGDTLYIGSTDESGHILLCLPRQSTYALSVDEDSYLPHSEHFKPAHREWGEDPINKEVLLKKIGSRSTAKEREPVVLSNVLFETNSDQLQPGSFNALDKLYNFLNANNELRIIIRGHTDNVGDADMNHDLSMRRAKSVYDYLLKKGINAVRLDYEGLGESEPIADNDTEAGREENRRTEFRVVN